MVQSPEGIAADGRRFEGVCSAKALAELFGRDDPSERFLDELLATQCRLAKADAGAILRPAAPAGLEVLAAFPRHDTHNGDLAWIGMAEKSIHKVMQTGKTVMVREASEPPDNGAPRCYQIIIPIQDQNVVRAAAVFRIRARTRRKLLLSHARLETTSLLLNYHELRLSMRMKHESMDRLRRVLEVLDVVNRSNRFLGASMAVCNEVAARLNCSRVSLGVLKGRCVQVRAMSHTDTFNREMKAVQAIEAAMEECLDQDLEVIHPADDTALYASRAAAKLAERHGPSGIMSLPLREDGKVTAVMTLERSLAQPFDNLAEIETVRLICDLCSPRLSDLHRSDQWLGARMAAGIRDAMGELLGPEHTWIKLVAGLVFVLAVLLTTLKGDYRINAPFALEAQHQMVVVAPFDTFSKDILVEPGDRVIGGQTLLGTLETSELRLKRAALKAEQLGYQKQMSAAMRDRKIAETQIAQAQSDKVGAEIRLIDMKIVQADLMAPISGWVVSEDMKQQIGAPVETGDILFEIAGIEDLRAELYVPEASIADVMPDHTGELASLGYPDQKVAFVVERINPIAEVIDHQNVFRVRVRLLEHLEWMRPGMEGEAKISAGEKSYLWLASHRLVNWLRMKLWV